MKAVFDWDGVFNNQVEFLADYLGMPVPDSYWAEKASNVTLYQARAIQCAYYDMEQYARLPLADGFVELLHKDPAPYIYSKNMGLDMEYYKRELISKLAPKFPEDHLILIQGLGKPVLDWADVMVEDAAHYLERYPPTVLRILMDHAYNRSCKLACFRAWDLRHAMHIIQDHFSVWG